MDYKIISAFNRFDYDEEVATLEGTVALFFRIGSAALEEGSGGGRIYAEPEAYDSPNGPWFTLDFTISSKMYRPDEISAHEEIPRGLIAEFIREADTLSIRKAMFDFNTDFTARKFGHAAEQEIVFFLRTVITHTP
ncbi:hypothetical protein [Parvularcula dongshanensis]|uniref:Uncharacterized protein n=1 Tax=Parvularcula dongshanensis TaxID=1173995 RepID=A0A840I6I6_9PROT|nr:hypothetical protein [Parvularcula dongshanensis]MBB4659915.1 hypothetical protein [Parvularcula dongshanensis]